MPSSVLEDLTAIENDKRYGNTDGVLMLCETLSIINLSEPQQYKKKLGFSLLSYLEAGTLRVRDTP